MRDQDEGMCREGRREDTSDHGLLVQKVTEGKTSYELNWREKTTIKRKRQKKKEVKIVTQNSGKKMLIHDRYPSASLSYQIVPARGLSPSKSKSSAVFI